MTRISGPGILEDRTASGGDRPPPLPVKAAALSVLLPLLAACLIIWLEPLLGQLAQDRPGIVPVVVLSLIVGIILPESRRWLLVTLCFGVALMAFRDAIRALQ